MRSLAAIGLTVVLVTVWLVRSPGGLGRAPRHMAHAVSVEPFEGPSPLLAQGEGREKSPWTVALAGAVVAVSALAGFGFSRAGPRRPRGRPRRPDADFSKVRRGRRRRPMQ